MMALFGFPRARSILQMISRRRYTLLEELSTSLNFQDNFQSLYYVLKPVITLPTLSLSAKSLSEPMERQNAGPSRFLPLL